MILLLWAWYQRFAPGNDDIWGKGNWIMCTQHNCMNRKPVFHHRDFHT